MNILKVFEEISEKVVFNRSAILFDSDDLNEAYSKNNFGQIRSIIDKRSMFADTNEISRFADTNEIVMADTCA